MKKYIANYVRFKVVRDQDLMLTEQYKYMIRQKVFPDIAKLACRMIWVDAKRGHWATASQTMRYVKKAKELKWKQHLKQVTKQVKAEKALKKYNINHRMFLNSDGSKRKLIYSVKQKDVALPQWQNSDSAKKWRKEQRNKPVYLSNQFWKDRKYIEWIKQANVITTKQAAALLIIYLAIGTSPLTIGYAAKFMTRVGAKVVTQHGVKVIYQNVSRAKIGTAYKSLNMLIIKHPWIAEIGSEGVIFVAEQTSGGAYLPVGTTGKFTPTISFLKALYNISKKLK